MDENIVPTIIEDELKSSFIDYAMSVLVSRALPDVRDGLKPVHRRILYAMNEIGMTYNKPYKKSARIVGEVLGKYHPHGDSSVYDAMVRMTQDFSLRHPLIDGQGNFGSIDGDSAAAMRYTEARLAKISDEILADIDKNTVDTQPNFDESLTEPVVLPSKLPNLLINGTSGIAVGMATNIPPHNLVEVCDCVIQVIDDPETPLADLIETIKGPDFPTGGILCGRNGAIRAYTTGHGKIKIRSRMHLEEAKGKESLIVTEIPYMVNKSGLLEEIANLIKDKIITEISSLKDESDREGMRIVIGLKKGCNPEIVKNQLYKHSRLESSMGMMLIALVDNVPRRLNLKQIIDKFIEHRITVVTRRTQFELNKAEERAHILEGLIIALDDIDNVIDKIRKSSDVAQAKEVLMQDYELSEAQSKAILDMRLQKLASLEQQKIKSEYDELQKLIRELKDILENKDRVLEIIKQELTQLKLTYGNSRRTQIMEVEDDIEIEDLIDEEDMVITISHEGYIKRMPIDSYKEQNRGGKGIIGAETKDDDFVEHLFIANTHSYLLIFTNKGKVYWLKVYKVPEVGRYSKGKAIVNLIEMDKGEKISAVIPVKEFKENYNLLFGTKKGIAKKTSLMEYSRPRQGGIWAINLDEDDDVIDVVMTDGSMNIILASKEGQAVKFNENDVRAVGRYSKGVIGMRLKGDDEVIGMVLADDDRTLLTVTANGYGKRTEISEYRLINRGGTGVINIKTTDRNGPVVSIKSVTDDDQLMIITKEGQVIRTGAKFISVIGRNTQGVRLMRLNDTDTVSDAAKLIIE